MKRLVLKAALFLFGLAVLSVLAHRVDPLGGVELVGEKFERFVATRDDYDTVFVGSSYFYREISPALFDAAMAERGVASRSFNFGVPGMDPPETYYLVERILDAHPARLRCVVIELDYYREKVRPRNVHTRRFDYWHDPRRTVEVARAVLESDATRGKKVKDLGTHAEAFARRFFNVGRGSAAVAGLSDEGRAVALGRNLDGFRSLDEEESATYELRRNFFEGFEGDRLDEKVAALRGVAGGEAAGDGVGASDAAALDDVVALVRARGATPVLLVPPCLAKRADLIELARRHEGVPLLVFNSPDDYPELYDTANRYDLGHLNERGARVFTALLAERLAALVTSR